MMKNVLTDSSKEHGELILVMIPAVPNQKIALLKLLN
jgi:hypothetical protein